jgi:hypothetical protein
VLEKGAAYTVQYGRRKPICRSCKRELSLAALADGKLDCACGAATAVRAADDLARSLVTTARFVVDETDERLPLHVLYLVCELADNAHEHAKLLGTEKGRRKAASAADLDPELARELATDDERDIRAAIARNRAAPADVLAKLAGDREDKVVVALAHNASLPDAVLDKLAQHRERDVVTAIAKRPDLPAALFAQLASHTDTTVRVAIAAHPQAPADVIAQLAGDRDRDVRRAIVLRTELPPAALVALAQDDNTDIMTAYQARRDHPKEAVAAAARGPKYCRTWAARHELADEMLLRTLAADDDTEVSETARARIAALDAAMPKFVPQPAAAPTPAPVAAAPVRSRSVLPWIVLGVLAVAAAIAILKL